MLVRGQLIRLIELLLWKVDERGFVGILNEKCINFDQFVEWEILNQENLVL